MVAPAAAVESVARKLAGAGADPSLHPVVVVHVSAGNPFRRWPAAAFVDLLTALLRADRARRIVVVSGPSEQTAARDIGAQARAALGPDGAGLIDDVEFDLGELRALMDVAALFIGGDSGPLHVAGTSRRAGGRTLRPDARRALRAVAAVALRDRVGRTAEIPCRPCDQRRCEPGDYRCLGSISPDRVAEAAERALRRAGRYGD